MRNFRTLTIWKDGVQLSVDIYKLVETFPKRETYGLVSQITRAAISIPSNIAEGCRGSNKELLHYLNIALGSSFELETQLIIAKEINYLDAQKFQLVLEQLNKLQKSINAFRSSIKN